MHDPCTVAFSTRYITVWHVDPSRGGDEDSCGWFYPTPPRNLVASLHGDMGWCTVAAGMLRDQWRREGHLAWWLLWLERASFYHRNRRLSSRHISRVLYQHSFPGERDSQWIGFDNDTRYSALIIARAYMALIRPWYRHPRWHVWHWSVQVTPLLHFKRWAFSRCCHCGKRFSWGEAPLDYGWSRRAGPSWFKSEIGVSHMACDETHGPDDICQPW